MTELAADGNIAEIDDADGEEASRIGDYLASHGGPFFELQRRLGMLREDALLAGRRAALFVALAWGVPFLLSLVAGRAFSLADGRAYLVDFGAWARFFIAIGLFMLSEQQIEYGLNGKLGQLVRAPIIAPDCFAAAASAVVRALRLRDSRAAEIICLGLAIVGTLVWLTRLTASRHSSWAVQIAGDGAHVTLAGWWSVICSAPLFYFLLFRGLWRYIVWAMLLWRIASLKLRLVATHPDGKGGLAFLAEYPNAYVCVWDQLRLRDHRRQACVRGQHFVRHLRLHHHRVARDRVRVLRLSAAGVLQTPGRAEGKIGRGPRRPGDPLPSRRGARPDRAQPGRQ
jgi:hypothetical protein